MGLCRNINRFVCFAKCIILHFQKSVTSCTICQWCCCSVYQRCYMYVEVSANGAVLHCELMMSCSTVCSWCCHSVYQSAMCTKGALLLMVLSTKGTMLKCLLMVLMQCLPECNVYQRCYV